MEGKTVVLGITGSIAAYKMANVASALIKRGADVHVIMTENATKFIHPITFETLTNHKCLVETFDRNFQFHVAHVSLAKQADVMMIAPASANIIGKMAHGIADDMLTTTVLACKAPVLVAPAMNTNMLENAIVQENIEYLRQHGMTIIEPDAGRLACGDTGSGKLANEETMIEHIEYALVKEKDLLGKKVLITAGPTQEAIDPVRYITNHSSGKMGYAIAKAARKRGAEVTLVSGKTNLDVPLGVECIDVISADDMFEAVTARAGEQDIIVKAAAVADYRPSKIEEQKMKKSDGSMSLELERTDDILQYIGERKRENQFICGFAMETEHLLERAEEKRKRKHVDMIVANSISQEGAGFQGDTNIVTIVTEEGTKPVARMSKDEIADVILDEIVCRMKRGFSQPPSYDKMD